jgi:general secretion pathway protein K
MVLGTSRMHRVQQPLTTREKGVALIMVLWVLLLVTITSGAFALMARMDQLEAHSVMWSTQARLAAEAGINLGFLHLRDPIQDSRWVPDGRTYELVYEDILLEIQVTDERGKVNINEATEESLARLFSGNGMEEEYAELLAAAVADWRDPDELERPNGAEDAAYESAGLEIGPGNHKFVLIEELLQVLGMPWELFKKLEPAVTVYEDSPLPDPAYGPPEALVALPDITPEEALNFVEERRSQEPGAGPAMALPGGQVAMARGMGVTYSIQAKATLPNGVWDQLRATIRLGATNDGRPFRILRWREGFHE